MNAGTARNIALVALVVVAWVFAVETAVMGAVLQKQGETESSTRGLLVLSVGSLMVSVLACGRAVLLIRGTTPPALPIVPAVLAPRVEPRRDEVLAV